MIDTQAIEAGIEAMKANRAPRVTPADIEANIANEVYFTAADGAAMAQVTAMAPESEGDIPEEVFVNDNLFLLTICVLTLQNGFMVTGESACASPENFNAEIGKQIARANAVQKIWPLMGYQLREKLAANSRVPPVRLDAAH